MEKCLIVAIADDNGIGAGGDLLWHISADLKYFKEKTLGCPVIMGRTTFDSIGRPLPGRKNIVLTRRGGEIPGAVTAGSLEEAYSLSGDVPRCFVLGGASVYREALGDMDKLYVTKVHTVVPGADAFFPEIDTELWEVESSSPLYTDDETGYKYEFLVYNRTEWHRKEKNSGAV